MSKHTVGDTEASMSDSEHSSLVKRVSSVGTESIDWIGPNVHTPRPSADAEKLVGDQPAGYLGPTSYSAIFRENKLGETQEDFSTQSTSVLNEYEVAKPVAPEHENVDLESQYHIDQGIRILHRYPDRIICDRLLDRYFVVCDVMLPEPTIRYCHESIWSTYGNYLREPRTNERLSVMSRELCKNATSPLPASSNTKEWTESFSGHRLRWEIVGNLFTIFGISVMTVADWDPLFATNKDGDKWNKRQSGESSRECAEACLALCNDIDSVNDFVISLMSAAYALQSWYEGDTSQQLWRRHGGLASAVTALGLHREADLAYSPTTNISPSFMVSEFRRRLFCYVFITDKQLATFMGRPPALSRRYTTCQIPLDLSDDEIMAEGEELETIRSKLDPNGWSTSGKMYPSTVCRAWMFMSLIRDEILEISLGPPLGANEIQMRRDELKRRSEERYAQMPHELRWQPDDIERHRSMSAFQFSLQMALYQEFNLNKFLIERLPDEGSFNIKQDLVNTARKMLDGILVLCANRDKLTNYAIGFVWAIVYHGIPAAAILSVELLKPSKFPQDWRLSLPRSEIIQNLSIFIGALEWVRPSEGNYTLCIRMRKVIKRILDQVLDMPPPNSRTQESNAFHDPAPPDLAISSILGPQDEPDFLEWLNSVDWTRDMLQDAWT